MKVLCFSHNRPLQFKAYTESLYFYTGEDLPHIICKDNEDALYIGENGGMTFIEEEWGGFDKVVRHWFDCSVKNKTVLLNTDDLIWHNFVSLNAMDSFLLENSSLIGISLRLGSNIAGFPQDADGGKIFRRWQWGRYGSHWGYPADLTSSIYRIETIREWLDQEKREIRGPNDFESWWVQWCWSNMAHKHPYYACLNDLSRCSALPLNRVQDLYQNATVGGDEASADNLKKLYKEGKRIDWESLYKIAPTDCFLEKKYFRIE